MYVCGPTVYDEPHIGHARSAYIFDVIRTYLEYRGYKVRFVRNVTDVDDKIIDKAAKEFPGEDFNSAAIKVSSKYLDQYHQALDALGIGKVTDEPQASAYIGKMIAFIGELVKKGSAYPSAGDVYFDITKAKDYGKLSHQSLANMEAGARIAPGEKKKNPLDFALWKSAKEGEPSWDSPWGKGRPGWHIECSAMSSDILGDQFDIHGGGLDLIFPHHENEIAQSEGAGKPFARYWIHHGLLTINAQKMSKSLGNFVTIKDFIGKYKDPDLLKFFFLSAHYSHPVDYTAEKIEEAAKQKQHFDDLFDKAGYWRLKEGRKAAAVTDKDAARIEEVCAAFQAAMDDDFNTSLALASLFDLINLASGFVSADKQVAFLTARDKLEEFMRVFGLKPKEVPPLSADIEALIIARELARKEKDFKRADDIRKEIETRFHLVLMDTAGGLTFIRLDKPA